jgi:hypothetical protein
MRRSSRLRELASLPESVQQLNVYAITAVVIVVLLAVPRSVEAGGSYPQEERLSRRKSASCRPGPARGFVTRTKVNW